MRKGPDLRTPYVEEGQQREADSMGLLVFLAAETMLFGALFGVALALRLREPQAYVAASRSLHMWIATANTAMLLTSSMFVARAVEAAADLRRRSTSNWLTAAALAGGAFLAAKGWEYRMEIAEGALPPFAGKVDPFRRLFMNLYVVATGLHALHLAAGIVILAVVATRLRLRSSSVAADGVRLAGLYWHFVHVVWIFLFPTLYLAR